MTNSISLTHFFTFFSKLGGVETLLKNHLANDGRWDIDPRVVAFFEKEPKDNPRVSGIGLTWRDCVASTRIKFRSKLQGTPPLIALYHNFWGIPFVSDLDRATFRIALLHSDWPGINDTLRAQRGLVDGVMCVNDVLRRQIMDQMPDLPEDRIAVLPLPIASIPVTAEHTPLGARPIVCGFSGRVVKAQKRVDRLPRLCEELDHIGLDYQFEILGDGPERKWLERRFSGNPRIRIHGRRSGDAYWNTLSKWDVIVFTSDYEGLPISMLEAFSLGILPIYPRIKTGGDRYAAEVRPDFLYDPDDFRQVARVLKSIKAASDDSIQALRHKAKRLAEAHKGDAYLETYAAFVRHIVAQPKISPVQFPPRPFYPSDYLPFAAMRRFYYRGFYHRNDGGRAG